MDLDVDLTEFNKLAKLLEEADIPHTNERFFEFGNGRQIIIFKDKECKEKLVDVICHHGSYGKDKGLLEIMGGLTKEESEHDSVKGYLTADEVFKRFKYCYEHTTDIYNGE